MARSTQTAVTGEITADEQAQFDEMRAGDNEQVAEQPQAQVEPPEQAVADEGAETEGGEQQADGRQKMVPHAALHEERERRKEVERRADEQRTRDEQRVNMLLQRISQQSQAPAQPQQQAPAAPVLPEVDKDPVGHIVGRQTQIEQALGYIVQALNQQNQQTTQQTQQSQALNQLTEMSKASERAYVEKVPDYADAVNFLRGQRATEMEIYGTPAAERDVLLYQEALGIAASALQRNQDPADTIYRMAVARGYKKPEPATPAADAGQRLEQVNRGQQQTQRSLGNVRGSGPAPLNANALLQMSDKDFAKAMESPENLALLGS